MIVYMFVSKVSKKPYIGKTHNLERRIWEHLNCAIAQTPVTAFHKALKKYGLDGFEFSILEYCSRQDLDEAERKWIALLGSKSPRGYNLTDGGDGFRGGTHTEEWSALMSAKMSGDVRKGDKNPNYRNHKPWSEKRRAADPIVHHSTRPEVRAKIAAGVAAAHARGELGFWGDANPAKRPEVRAKISAGLRGRKRSPESYAKQAASLRAHYANKKGASA